MATSQSTLWTTRIPTPVGDDTTSCVLALTSLTLGAAADILKITPLPGKGISITDCFMACSDMDTNATPTLDITLRITDGTTTKVLILASTVGQAGGVIRPTKVPASEPGIGYAFDTDDYWLELLINTASATPAAGTLNIGLIMNGWYKTGSVTE